MNIPYMLSDNSISVVVEGDLLTADRDSVNLDEITDILNQEDPDVSRLRDIFDPKSRVEAALDGTGVSIVGSCVTYLGKQVPSHLETRILDIVARGLSVEPWKRFVKRLFANPSKTSRDELILLLEGSDLPITEDGCFLAWKRVTSDYKDLHSGSFDNSVGSVVEMARNDVDDNRNNLCSTGLHFCSKEYLKHFYKGGGRIVVVKIDPADVVSVPADYNNTKGRTWKYEVIGEVATDDDAAKHEWGVIEVAANWYDDDYDEDGWFYEDDDEDVDWDDDGWDAPDVQETPAVTAFVAPSSSRRSWWRKPFRA